MQTEREGGVGIVCHQMNSWGETNDECREKEGGILIGLSLCVSLQSPLGENMRLNAGSAEVKRDFEHCSCKHLVPLIDR